jgi:hypothetical protein
MVSYVPWVNRNMASTITVTARGSLYVLPSTHSSKKDQRLYLAGGVDSTPALKDPHAGFEPAVRVLKLRRVTTRPEWVTLQVNEQHALLARGMIN